MSWKVIDEADILTRMSAPELDALRYAAIGDDQADPVQPAITQVTDIVRGYCASRYELGPEGTIPSSLLGPALDILILDIQTRPGGMIIDPDDERRKKSDRAYTILKQVASGTFAIDDATGTGHQSGGGAIRVTHNRPRVTRQTLKGL